MSNKLGFIGCGKMAKAIINGTISAGFDKKNIIASSSSELSAEKNSKELNINVVANNKKVVEFADTIFIATKPNQVIEILSEIKDLINNEKLIISLAAGISTEKIEVYTNSAPVIRVMPNTPVLVKEGISATVKGKFATNSHEQFVQKILSKIGKVISVQENQIDVVTAISGSGPAFFYQIFEDFAQAGVKLGLDYDKALLLAVQTAIGSAKMTLNRKTPLTDLVASVATKGGCTEVGIQTMYNLESEKMLFEIIKNTAQKAHELG